MEGTMASSRSCRECPFRRTAAAGYLGDVTGDPLSFLNGFALGELYLPCHLLVDWDAADAEEKADQAGPCVGALIFLANQCKLPRDQEIAARVRAVDPDPDEVFSTAEQFCQHHLPGIRIMTVGHTVHEIGGGE